MNVAEDGRADFAKMAEYLEALASPARLELLHLLRHPRSVSDIKLPPSDPGQGPERSISRQGVKKHLERLVEAGFVIPQYTRQRAAEEFVVDHTMLFALVEELRRLTQLSPYAGLAPAPTLSQSTSGIPRSPAGPRIIVVHGPVTGKTFSLDRTSRSPDRGWVLGRRRGLAVSLDHDPFLSQQHAEIVVRGPQFWLQDLPTNKNGTMLNWETLPRGGEAPLTTGDLISVGRTLLLFRGD